uniref:Uncharacterized protein n=1 Tax=Kalanchoe fedtschenkoi TaxID=63787 RepID=A0A7N0T092_KALFE
MDGKLSGVTNVSSVDGSDPPPARSRKTSQQQNRWSFPLRRINSTNTFRSLLVASSHHTSPFLYPQFLFLLRAAMRSTRHPSFHRRHNP